ncbi:MAG: AP2 domain-containing protein [Rubripirellula sp.]
MKNLKNIRRAEDGWVVRLVRDGTEYSKYFRFSNGGVRKSFAAAKAWRDEIVSEVGPRQWRTGPNRKKPTNNTSGTIGVSKNKFGRWVASWNENGKQRFKTFPTKREAVAHRKEQVASLS